MDAAWWFKHANKEFLKNDTNLKVGRFVENWKLGFMKQGIALGKQSDGDMSRKQSLLCNPASKLQAVN